MLKNILQLTFDSPVIAVVNNIKLKNKKFEGYLFKPIITSMAPFKNRKLEI